MANTKPESSETDPVARTTDATAPSDTKDTPAPAESAKVWTAAPDAGEDSDKADAKRVAADKAAAEDESLRLANPNKVVYRKADGSVGGQSMVVGQKPDEN